MFPFELPAYEPFSPSGNEVPAAPEQGQPAIPPGSCQARSGRSRDDDPLPRRSKSSDGDTAAAAMLGVSAGMLAIVGGVLLACCCVVLSIGGIAVALIFPAIQKVREAATRVESTNRLKVIGLAFHGFHDTNKRLPFNGSDTEVGGTKYSAAAQNQDHRSGSWGFQVLPYMDHAPLFHQVNKNAPVIHFMCPARNRPMVESNNGPWSDFFYNNYLNDAMQASNPRAADLKRTMVGVTDGTSNTIFIGYGNINTTQYTSATNVTMCSTILQGGTNGTMRAGNPGATSPAGVTLQQDSANAPGIGSWGGPLPSGALMCLGDATVRMFRYPTNNFSVFLTPTGNEPAFLPDF